MGVKMFFMDKARQAMKFMEKTADTIERRIRFGIGSGNNLHAVAGRDDHCLRDIVVANERKQRGIDRFFIKSETLTHLNGRSSMIETNKNNSHRLASSSPIREFCPDISAQ